MARLFHLTFIAIISAWLSSAAQACEFVAMPKNGPAVTGTFETIADGIVSGALRCGRDVHSAYVWTLPVDGNQESLGIRDDRLLDTGLLGSLGELLAAEIEDHVNLTVYERNETIGMARSPLPRPWFRMTRFFTFCENTAGADPLDCSVGKVRIKGQRVAEDTDRDGYLDRSVHEISYYDGASKLHFMQFVTPWSQSMTVDAGLWIEAVNAMSDVLKPKKFAAVAP